MTTNIPREKVFFAFSPRLKAIAQIEQGEEVLMQTHDCFEGQIQTTRDLVDSLDWSHVNPVTGPLYITGTRPGDVLRIDLLELKVGEQSSMVTIPGEGALGDVITQMETTILKREGDRVVFKDKIKVALKPMIGVIGVAPAEGELPTGTPGPHGGNMDCNLIAAGNRVYFTVNVEEPCSARETCMPRWATVRSWSAEPRLPARCDLPPRWWTWQACRPPLWKPANWWQPSILLPPWTKPPTGRSTEWRNS